MTYFTITELAKKSFESPSTIRRWVKNEMENIEERKKTATLEELGSLSDKPPIKKSQQFDNPQSPIIYQIDDEYFQEKFFVGGSPKGASKIMETPSERPPINDKPPRKPPTNHLVEELRDRIKAQNEQLKVKDDTIKELLERQREENYTKQTDSLTLRSLTEKLLLQLEEPTRREKKEGTDTGQNEN